MHFAVDVDDNVAITLCLLQKGDRNVAELVGVNQAHLQKLVQSGQRRNVSDADIEKERICKRFFMALMLNDVIQEVCGDVLLSA